LFSSIATEEASEGNKLEVDFRGARSSETRDEWGSLIGYGASEQQNLQVGQPPAYLIVESRTPPAKLYFSEVHRCCRVRWHG
jgi:hypothetical protein